MRMKRDCGPPRTWPPKFAGSFRLPSDDQMPLIYARHPDAAITSLIPWLSCRSRRAHAPFAELVRLSPRSVADEMREGHRRRVLGE